MAGLTNLKLVIPNKLPHFGHFFKRRAGKCSNFLLLDFSPKCDEQWKEKLSRDMQIYQDFITSDEEKNLLDEVEKKFKRTKYQFDHWDDVRLLRANIITKPFKEVECLTLLCRPFMDTERLKSQFGMMSTMPSFPGLKQLPSHQQHQPPA